MKARAKEAIKWLAGQTESAFLGASAGQYLTKQSPFDLSCAEEYEWLATNCQQNLVRVEQPLVLISQIQRSGGTLLSQLFDHHRQCHAHPFEFKIGDPEYTVWPVLNLKDTPEAWFDKLFERKVSTHLRYGYQKPGEGTKDDPDVFRFTFLPTLQKRLFLHYVYVTEIKSQRDIFNCYLTSYFNAWLDNRNLSSGVPKKYATAFSSHMHGSKENFDNFFSVYPDGFLIRCTRDPRSWWVSGRKHKGSLPTNLDDAIAKWKQSTELTLELKRQYPEKVFVLTFEQLVGETEGSARKMADFIGIEYDGILSTPTFNGMPIRANSSFAVDSHGILKEPLTRHLDGLSPEEQAFIEKAALSIYEEIVEQSGR